MERLTDVVSVTLLALLGLALLPPLVLSLIAVVLALCGAAMLMVLAGLVSVPVVAVPTSEGYGASFQGVAALLSMLYSCAPGVAVVNIDNGFGAGYLAAQINQMDRSKGD